MPVSTDTASPAAAVRRWPGPVDRPWLVVAAWAVLCALAIWQASHLKAILRGELGSVPGSMSDKAIASLSHDFDYPYAHLLIVTLEASAGVEAVAGQVAGLLRELPAVRGVRSLPSADPRLRALAVGLAATNLQQEEAAVPAVRKVVAAVVPPGVRALTTGHAALNVDSIKLGSAQASQAERRVLPIVLVALLFAFGAIGAAVAPLVAGAAAVLVAMGLLALVGHWLHLSILSANVATMVGLGLGIDYALFVVSRIREESGGQGESPAGQTASAAGRDEAAARREAIRLAALRTRPVILTSVGTVLIGFAALAFVPVPETVGMGIGGVIVALCSLLAALTLLPALATLLGPWLDAPRALSRRLDWNARVSWWQARARLVVRHPWLSLGASCVILGVLALPVANFRLGFPGFGVAPQSIESVQALSAVQRLGLGGALLPAQIIVRAPAGQPLLTPARVRGLGQLASWLEARPEVSHVYGLTGSKADRQKLLVAARMLGPAALAHRLPREGQALLSKDGAATLLLVVPANRLSYGEAREFTRFLRRQVWTRFEGLEDASVVIGGSTSIESDFIDLSKAAMPWLGLFVLGATFVSLFALTRSLVIPLKAVLTNLVTVGATLGCATWLFQSPVGSRLLGLPEPVMTVPALFPVMVFALLFGLSMDYETFLIARILESHRAGADDATAVVEGLGASGGIITSTALIMAVVFAGFAFSEVVSVRLLGTTLAIGILLDATVTRLLLVPSAIVLLGRLNWWPGGPQTRSTAAPPV